MYKLFAYPHSGAFWVRYIVEVSTRCPTEGTVEPETTPLGDLYPIGTDMSKDPVLIHKPYPDYSDKDSKAIFLVRNYKDLFVRRSFTKDDSDDFYQNTYLNEGYDEYMKVIKGYDDWCSDNRLLVYYDNLTSDFFTESRRIFDFLNVDTKDSRSFYDNYERHYRCCLGVFRRSYPGGDVTIRPGEMPKSMQVFMDEIMMYNSPILFGKYLSKYLYSD